MPSVEERIGSESSIRGDWVAHLRSPTLKKDLGEVLVATLIFGNSLYEIVDADPFPSWEGAEANAVDLGGHLVTINDASENEYLSTVVRQEIMNIYDLQYGYGIESDRAEEWRYSPLIGFSDVNQEGDWVWSSGEPVTYTNWWEGSPNNFMGVEYVAGIAFFGWNRDFDPSDPQWIGGWDDAPGGTIGIAEIPLNLSITTSDTPTEGAGVFTTSINLSAGSETSGNLANGAEVFWSISGIDADDLESGALAGSGFITDGKLDIDLSLVQDEDTGESLEISVFSDADRNYQIGETQSFEIMEGEVDPITGTLGLPGKVNLKNQGKTPFVLYGNEELVFDPEVQDSLINPESLGFGLVPGDTLFTAATKKNGTIHASYEDVDGDTYLDFVVKVGTPTIASSELAAGEQDVFAFATTNGGQDLLFTAPSAVFF